MNNLNSNNTSNIVYRSSFLMMAAAVCDQLEKAGIPANLCDMNENYCVCVPAVFARDSSSLLIAEPRRGEILYGYNRCQA
jgi:hypothetical protein